MKIGVYFIRLLSGHFYIGSTTDFPYRRRSHTSLLSRGIHSSAMLQQYYRPDETPVFECIPTNTAQEAIDLEAAMIERHWGNPLLCNTVLPSDPGRHLRGIPRTDEAKERMRIGRSGISPTAEQRERIGNAKLGSKHSSETIQKMSETRTGQTKSPEWVAKIAESFSQKVEVNGVTYPSATAAANALGTSANTVLNRCRNPNPKFSGWQLLD